MNRAMCTQDSTYAMTYEHYSNIILFACGVNDANFGYDLKGAKKAKVEARGLLVARSSRMCSYGLHC